MLPYHEMTHFHRPLNVKWDVVTKRIRRCRTCDVGLMPYPKEAEFCHPCGEAYEARWDKLRAALRDTKARLDVYNICGRCKEPIYSGVQYRALPDHPWFCADCWDRLPKMEFGGEILQESRRVDQSSIAPIDITDRVLSAAEGEQR